MMKAYRVKGTFPMGTKMTKFTIEVAGENEKDAQDHAFSVLGSRHRAERRVIKISSTEEIPKEQVKDGVVLHRIERSSR